jgi:hypothetical protein
MGTPYPKPVPKVKKGTSFKRNYVITREQNPLEESEQMALVDWLDIHGICYQASQMGAYLAPATFNRMKRMGCKPGFPDIMIYDRPYLCENGSLYVGCAIELKRKKGGIVSEEQSKWMERLAERGWACSICYGAEEAIAFLETLGYGNRKNQNHLKS